MNVNYEYYRLFYYVCKYHSITRAANVLRMSQPNVTRALNRLEEQLGCKLLVRSTRGVTMTPEGEVLFAHVEIAQEQLQAGESELAGITALESGALTISASETALNVFLLDKLREFHRRYPGVRLRIANHSTPQAIRALGRGLVDLCVITTPARLESTMRRTLLMPFQEILIAGRDFEFLQSLPGQKIIMKGNHDYWWSTANKMNAYLKAEGFDTLHILHNNSYSVEGYAICGTRGWLFDAGEAHDEKVMNREIGRLRMSLDAAEPELEKLVFLHYPPVYTGTSAPEIVATLKEYGIRTCFYGHLHGNAIRYAVQGDVDGIRYKLVSADGLRFCPYRIN